MVLKPNKFLLAALVHLGKLLTPTSHRVLVIANEVFIENEVLVSTLSFWTKVKEKLLQGIEYIPPG